MNEPFLFVGLVLMALSPVPLIIGINLLKWVRHLQKDGIQVNATVLEHRGRSPILTYIMKDGSHYQQKYRFFSSFTRYKEGEILVIYYDPFNPKKFWIKGDKTPIVLVLAFFIGILISISMAFLLMFVIR